MDDLAPFIKYRRRRLIDLVIVSTFFTVGAAGSIAIPIDDPPIRLVATGPPALLGLMLAWMAVTDLRRPNAFMAIVLKRPQDVVWIRPMQIFHEGSHAATSFRLQLADGTRGSAEVDPKFEADATEALRRRCPQADYGYTPELEAKHAPSRAAGVNAWTPMAQGDAAVAPLIETLGTLDRGLLWLGIPSALVAVVCLVAYVQLLEIILVVLAAIFGLIAYALLRVGLRPVQRHPLVKALDDGPSIASITLRYVHQDYSATPEPRIRVDLKSGRFYTVTLPPGTEKPLMAELERRLPHAIS